MQSAIDRCDFTFNLLAPILNSSTGKTSIPVEWTDLSNFSLGATSAEYDVLEYRNRVLGLAWYSGKISLDNSLVDNPEFAQEIFLAEAAHMVDFFYMTDAMRDRIVAVYESADGHGWFDVGGYNDWFGESWMSGFTLAFSDITPTISMTHEVTREKAREFRTILGVVEPEVEKPREFFRTRRGKKYHDIHQGLVQSELLTKERAEESGLRPCGRCKPQ